MKLMDLLRVHYYKYYRKYFAKIHNGMFFAFSAKTALIKSTPSSGIRENMYIHRLQEPEQIVFDCYFFLTRNILAYT
jgi:hypothetical protein